jgi:hypothetical protein
MGHFFENFVAGLFFSFLGENQGQGNEHIGFFSVKGVKGVNDKKNYHNYARGDTELPNGTRLSYDYQVWGTVATRSTDSTD